MDSSGAELCQWSESRLGHQDPAAAALKIRGRVASTVLFAKASSFSHIKIINMKTQTCQTMRLGSGMFLSRRIQSVLPSDCGLRSLASQTCFIISMAVVT